jgi:hypothetical protein
LRRALRHALPALAYHFGIHPWQVDDLTYGEAEAFLQALSDLNRER